MLIGSLKRRSTPLPLSDWFKRAVNQVTHTSGISEENKKQERAGAERRLCGRCWSFSRSLRGRKTAQFFVFSLHWAAFQVYKLIHSDHMLRISVQLGRAEEGLERLPRRRRRRISVSGAEE
ncbi:hypothetical protein PGIGA_G00146220 [Pangasianodon gigas]|uniref:Uncharacterized protein n=1 Tax=Pangasianodon gigas TaxID=30993 RepID=A0ACC5XNX6_PANGG|nr:hypothetical protein [Pangasianodon gigas]